MLENSRKSVKTTKDNSSGFSLIEVLVAIFVAILIGLAAVSLLNSRAVGIEDKTTVQEAETRAEEALSALTAVAGDLPIGGSFEVERDAIALKERCTSKNCDYVLAPDMPEELRTSPAKGYAYQSTGVILHTEDTIEVDGGTKGGVITGDDDNLPKGHQVAFLRRWRVDEVDGSYNLRKITVAIFKDEKSTSPMVLEESIIAINR
jgi:type II secretory pathway pseudopilin PulG